MHPVRMYLLSYLYKTRRCKNMNKKIFTTRSSMPTYEEYIEAIKPLWDSCWITNMGIYHQKLECQLKGYLKVPELSLMVNGHMALELVIQAMEFPEGAEVITSPFTFISTTHAIIRNHLTPVFCDVKIEDGTIDETKIEGLITDKTVAIIPIHVYGNICNIEKIQQIADRNGLSVIYDAAHAFGVSYKGAGIGNYGDASIFSFHATKVFHTIEGGAVAFKDHKLYEKLYNLKNFGIRSEEIVSEVGANAKMNEFSAIMGICNLNHIDQAIEKRKIIDGVYRSYLSNLKGIRIFKENQYEDRNYAYFPILVEDEYPLSRDGLYAYLKENNIYTRKYFYPITADQKCFGNRYKTSDLKNARELADRVLVLPLYEQLELEDVYAIVGLMRKAF